MHDACRICHGACCLYLTLPVKEDELVYDWLKLRGEERLHGISIKCKCSKLSNGRCTIYNERPEICRTYEVGSSSCLDAIERHHNRQTRRRIIEAIAESEEKTQA